MKESLKSAQYRQNSIPIEWNKCSDLCLWDYGIAWLLVYCYLYHYAVEFWILAVVPASRQIAGLCYINALIVKWQYKNVYVYTVKWQGLVHRFLKILL